MFTDKDIYLHHALQLNSTFIHRISPAARKGLQEKQVELLPTIICHIKMTALNAHIERMR